MSAEERVDDYRNRLRHDISITLRAYGYRKHGLNDTMWDALVEALVDDAMHPIEHLLLEVEEEAS